MANQIKPHRITQETPFLRAILGYCVTQPTVKIGSDSNFPPADFNLRMEGFGIHRTPPNLGAVLTI